MQNIFATKTNPVFISKPQYYFSMLTWLASLCFVFFSFLFDTLNIWWILLFALILIQGSISRAFSEKNPASQIKKRKPIDYCLIASRYISLSLVFIGLFSLIASGGGPEIIDGTYYLTSHGHIVRPVSYGWFVYLSICETLLFSCGILFFSTHLFLHTRSLYLNQQ